MIIIEREKQIIFLRECRQEIERLAAKKTFLGAEPINDELPANIPFDFIPSTDNLSANKLKILINIYNKAVHAMSSNEGLDLQQIFIAAKIEYNKAASLISKSLYADEVMSTHRSTISSLFSYVKGRPSSEIFLDKYGFFESKRQLPLHVAVTEKNLVEVKAILEKACVDGTVEKIINEKDNYGYGLKPLEIRTSPEISKLLSEYGATVDNARYLVQDNLPSLTGSNASR